MSVESPRTETSRNFKRARRMRKIVVRATLCLLVAFVVAEVGLCWPGLEPAASAAPKDLLSQLKEIPVATLSDAVDQVAGRRGFMSYDMRPIHLNGRLAGRAKTWLWGPERTGKHGIRVRRADHRRVPSGRRAGRGHRRSEHHRSGRIDGDDRQGPRYGRVQQERICSKNTLYSHLKGLEKGGLLEKRRQGPRVLYSTPNILTTVNPEES